MVIMVLLRKDIPKRKYFPFFKENDKNSSGACLPSVLNYLLD